MEEYQLRRNQALLIAQRQTSGNDARSLLTDPTITGSDTTNDLATFRLGHPDGKGKKCTKLKNHQAILRRQLQTIQNEKLKTDNDEEKKRLKKINMIEHKKKEKFGHIKPKVFECTDYTARTDTNSTAAISSFDSSSLQTSGTYHKPLMQLSNIIEADQCTNSLHSNFGRVPDYILRRKIEEGKKLAQMEEQQAALVKTKQHGNNEFSCDEKENRQYSRKADAKALRKDLDVQMNTIKASILNLPFGLQSQGSIRKRQVLEADLRRLEKEKRATMKRHFF
jgi:hypothetical protein